MKVSLNWIRDFLDLDKTPSEIADILTSLGLEVEGLETVKPSAADLDKVLTGRVVACEPIPDTDHLSATQVDLGDGVLRSIVCGAPNVAAGQKVLVAVPGANVFGKDGSLFAIGERKVRGVLSQGMICAEDELGIGHDHSGIMVLPEDTPLGIPADQYLKMDSDTVIEIGLTPNRADATNHRGVAFDLAAWLSFHEGKKDGIRQLPSRPLESSGNPYAVTVENPEACLRYTGVLIEGIQVKDSPDWLQKRLLALGQRPINNIVDITNYVRIEMGQPLHAFDADKIKGGKIIVQTLPDGTPFTTLDEVERRLSDRELMICDGQSNPMCIGGVFGGLHSGVTADTQNIFLESACFHPAWIRKSMQRLGVRTDSGWTFEKGVDPNGCVAALERALALVSDLAGGRVASNLVDIYPHPVNPVRIPVSYERIEKLIGKPIGAETTDRILAALQIGQEDKNDAGFVAIVPTNKPDVTREADVVEEILRVYGLDNVDFPKAMRTSMETRPQPDPDAVRNLVSDLLASQGFHECMSLSLSNSAYHTGDKPVLPLPGDTLVYVHNTANQGLDCMRPVMALSGLEAIRYNQNRQQADLRLFEFGKTYRRTDKMHEEMRLGLWITGAVQAESWRPVAREEVDFYTLKAYVHRVLDRLGLSGFQESQLETDRNPEYLFGMLYHRGPQELVRFGRVAPPLQRALEIKQPVFFADFNFENVLSALKNNQVRYREISKFPSVRRDLALVLDKEVTFGEIRQVATKTVKHTLKDVNLFDVFEDEAKIGAGKKSYAVSFIFEHTGHTLQENEIETIMQQLQDAFASKLKAVVRS